MKDLALTMAAGVTTAGADLVIRSPVGVTFGMETVVVVIEAGSPPVTGSANTGAVQIASTAMLNTASIAVSGMFLWMIRRRKPPPFYRYDKSPRELVWSDCQVVRFIEPKVSG